MKNVILFYLFYCVSVDSFGCGWCEGCYGDCCCCGGEELIKQQIANLKTNVISNLKNKADNIISGDVNGDQYKCLSCIYGAFIGDALGSYFEFSQPQQGKASSHDYNNKNIFGATGYCTDDSEMAMSMAYGIMEGKGVLNKEVLPKYYKYWLKTAPVDKGYTTMNALKNNGTRVKIHFPMVFLCV